MIIFNNYLNSLKCIILYKHTKIKNSNIILHFKKHQMTEDEILIGSGSWRPTSNYYVIKSSTKNKSRSVQGIFYKYAHSFKEWIFSTLFGHNVYSQYTLPFYTVFPIIFQKNNWEMLNLMKWNNKIMKLVYQYYILA